MTYPHGLESLVAFFPHENAASIDDATFFNGESASEKFCTTETDDVKESVCFFDGADDDSGEGRDCLCWCLGHGASRSRLGGCKRR